MKNTTRQRLESLPNKVALPLRHLYDIGQVTPRLMEAVLDAGEIAGNTHHLLGFTAGLAALEMQHVPALDTIKMAKKLDRPVRLNWSPRRWREEHDRYSRLLTFRELVAENVKYDVSSYEALLPDTFPGYVVSSRKKLAMIGHVQRYCVASYHDQIVAGRIAIVCVFLNKTRWTVEVTKTHFDSSSFTIRQIRTTDNRVPNPIEEAQIYKALGRCQEDTCDSHIQQRIRSWLQDVNNARIFDALVSANVEQVIYQHDTEPGLLPPLSLQIAPEAIDLKDCSVEIIPISDELVNNIATGNGNLPISEVNLHETLAEYFKNPRNYYQADWRTSVQINRHPYHYWEICLHPSVRTIDTRWVARSNRKRFKPREHEWTIVIPSRREAEGKNWWKG